MKPMSIKRRDFLKQLAGAALSWPLASCYFKEGAASRQENHWSSQVETWMPSVCGACPGGCGILVRKIDNRVVKIEGNPLHPLNRGKLCSRGQAGVQLLYNPTRVKTPLLKVGERSSGKWREISWEEALNMVASKLTALRNSGKAHSVIYLGPLTNQLSDSLISRFLKVYGSPNNITIDPWEVLKKAYSLAFGASELMAFDFENSKYILSFSSQFLTNWPNSLEIQRIYAEKRAKGGLRIVQFEPYFSVCAARADRWVPIRPGTEGLLALGIASVILKEQLYDKNYLDQFGARFEDWFNEQGEKIPGFKTTAVNLFRLEEVAEKTAVPLKTIIEIAREFASTKPALALADYTLSYHEQGLFNSLAVLSLNALIGSIDRPGGLVRSRSAPLKTLPAEKLDDLATNGLLQPRIDDETKNWLFPPLDNPPYEINCLLISPHQLPGNFPFLPEWAEISQKIPFIVSFQPYLDESNQHVDLVLPDTTYFEKWQLVTSPPLTTKTAIGVGKPVVAPFYESRPFEDIIISLAQKMGGSIAANFSWASLEEIIIDRLSGLFEAHQGTVFLPLPEELQLKVLEERGWWVSKYETMDDFMAELFKNGGWQDPVYHFQLRSNTYQNPQRKFIFFSPAENSSWAKGLKSPEPDYPLELYLYDLPFTLAGNGAQMPFFQESLGFRVNCEWKIWIEINPETAKEMNIKENEWVWVESPHGKVKAVAKLYPGVSPGLLAMPWGKEVGFPPSAKNRKTSDPLTLLAESKSIQKSFSSRLNIRVRIYHARGGTE